MRTTRHEEGGSSALAALTLIAAACGDDDDDGDAAGTDAPAGTERRRHGCPGRHRSAGRHRCAGRHRRPGRHRRTGRHGGGGEGDYVIGVSNTLAGNGWREEMICAVKAQSLASGQVSEVIAISKNGGPTEQIQDLQNLISQGVNAIIVNPSDREQLNPVIEEAIAQGIVVVAVDQAVTAEGAYVATNDQVDYGRLGAAVARRRRSAVRARVLYMRGIDGVPADADRDTGFQEVMAEYPDIEIKEVFTGWDFTQGGDIAVQELTAADYDGIWTSGIDYTVVNAFDTVGKEPVPVSAPTTTSSSTSCIDGTPGAAVTNPAVIGGVGTAIALGALNGEEPEQDDAADAAGVGPREQPGRARGQLLPGPRRHVQLGRHGRGLHHLHARAALRLQGPGRVT